MEPSFGCQQMDIRTKATYWTYTYVYEYVPKRAVYVRTHVRTYVRTYICTYVRTFVSPYVRTHARTDVQTYKQSTEHPNERPNGLTHLPTYVRIPEKITYHFLANLNKRPGERFKHTHELPCFARTSLRSAAA